MSLPIGLCLAEVTLAGSRDSLTAVRWTLGPSWYEDYKYDERIMAYYDGGDRSIESIDQTSGFDSAEFEPVRGWAAAMIAKTTDYRVTGWDGPLPRLDHERHTLKVWTIDGARSSYVVGSNARSIIERLSDPEALLVFGEFPDERVYIPVRAITSVSHTVTRSAIKNG